MRQEKWVAQLKAKKQQSSKDSEKKDNQLKYLLKAMHMAKSTYYFEINRNDIVAERNQEVLEEIQYLNDHMHFRFHPYY